MAEREREKTYRTPYGGNHKVAGVTAVVDETVRLASFIPPPRDRSHPRKETTHDIDASDTLTRGRSRSSFNRALSSVSRRYLRSATLCFLFLTSPPDRSSNAGGMVIFWCRWWVVQVVGGSSGGGGGGGGKDRARYNVRTGGNGGSEGGREREGANVESSQQGWREKSKQVKKKKRKE